VAIPEKEKGTEKEESKEGRGISEDGDMTVKNFIFKGICPVLFIGILLYWGQFLYLKDGTIDWLMLALVVGVPVGIPHMFFVIPGSSRDMTGTMRLIAFCILIGGLTGSIHAVVLLVKACWYLIGFPVSRIFGVIHRKSGKIIINEN
jgi:hypothetical protein